ncbi:membrane protein insertase YidC [Herbiconiux sp. L3-i23]|uniref:membrane protein insertase YidC n=1 Tax=Herbiconiux sp. L3-i23 TaxID=2905871 RepID=UPI002068EE72|nr:membrane protein insertase YidC [Herbiconiux sp. L3-i23]BDI21961.1 hypothetical protein L3i23_07370 [Herbiconiux sp. L3-i23]
MDPFTFPPIAAVLDVAYSAVAALADLLAPFAGTSSAAAAIAVTTMLVRLALLPAGIASARSAAAARRIGPQIADLRARFAKKPEKLQQELADLYRREGASPLSGCLPLVAQIPVVAVVYALFTRTDIGAHANDLLAHSVAGVPLGMSLPHSLLVAADP